ncbi:hypothetical protein NQ317_012076 [Molorchus minor]|uniref:Transposase n=1 Tax=Molorchus minor TaxID=1323400 RepID=A0ABQ9K8H1_9CUCU|nr:hypothetical protein NQ317_012076 [Molorchus minor]
MEPVDRKSGQEKYEWLEELAMKKIRIFYLDETWVNEGYGVSKVWEDKIITNTGQEFMTGWLEDGLKMPTEKRRRLIIMHMGSESGDYHKNLNPAVFRFDCLELPLGSVVVMDNAFYHSQRECTEQLATEKRNDESLVKAELLTLVRHFPNFKKYVCELNPIELICAQIKGKAARENTTFKLADVKKLLEAAVGEINADNWVKCINYEKGGTKNLDFDIMMDIANLRQLLSKWINQQHVEYWEKQELQQSSTTIIGALTGHCPLQRNLHKMRLANDPTCRRCGEDEKSALHGLCYCEGLARCRLRYLGQPFVK